MHTVSAGRGFGEVDIFCKFCVFEVPTKVIRLHKYFRIYLNLSSITKLLINTYMDTAKYQTDNENDRSSDE